MAVVTYSGHHSHTSRRYLTEVNVLASAPKECACVWTDSLHVCMRAHIVARWPPFVSWGRARVTCSLLRSSRAESSLKYIAAPEWRPVKGMYCTPGYMWNRLSKMSRAYASLASAGQIKFKMSDVGIFESLKPQCKACDVCLRKWIVNKELTNLMEYEDHPNHEGTISSAMFEVPMVLWSVLDYFHLACIGIKDERRRIKRYIISTLLTYFAACVFIVFLIFR